MSNTATVSFKIKPEHYTVLKALAESRELTLSEFVRETIERALDLDDQARLLRSLVGKMANLEEE